MYIYRCTFILTEYNGLATNMFIRGLDEESVKRGSSKLFKEQLVKHGIPDAVFVQEVRLSSEEESEQYSINMKNNVKTRTMVN